MANIDYVIVGAGPSLVDVTEAVRAQTGGIDYPSDERATLRVIADPEVSGGHVVQVRYAGDPPSLGQAYARRLYDALVAGTDWELTLDSDESEGVIAVRTRVHA